MNDVERTARLAAECERENNNTEPPPGAHCPGTFDGWVCWRAAPAPSDVAAHCPDFVPGFNPELFAHKQCLENGSWWRHPVSNKPWSNYTGCVEPADDMSGVITTYEVTYGISLFCLLVSMGIILHFKSLRCPRMVVHCHLFASCALNNVLWLAVYALVVRAPATVASSPAWCRALHAATNYALLATYSWALCEGLYLHAVLVHAFVPERRVLRVLAPLGWLAPAPFALYGAASRALAGEALCWLEGDARWELLAPAAAALLLNALVLANVLRVLCSKLRSAAGGVGGAGPRGGEAGARTLRAACLLAPLLGLQYLLLPARPARGARGWLLYEYVAALGCGLQGAAVAALYCFCNGEVHAALRRRLAAATWLQDATWLRDARSRANSNTNTTVSFVRHAGGGGGGGGGAGVGNGTEAGGEGGEDKL